MAGPPGKSAARTRGCWQPAQGLGPAHQQLPALAGGAPRGAAGHRAGSDEWGSEPRCEAGPPPIPRSGCPLPDAGLTPAGSGVLAGAHHRQGGAGKASEPNAPPASTLSLGTIQSRQGSPGTPQDPTSSSIFFSRKSPFGEKPCLPLSPKPSCGHGAPSPSRALDVGTCLPHNTCQKPSPKTTALASRQHMEQWHLDSQERRC